MGKKEEVRTGKDEGTLRQAKHLLSVVLEVEPTTAQIQALCPDNTRYLKELLRNAETLDRVNFPEFVALLRPNDDYWSFLPRNPFEGEACEVKDAKSAFYQSLPGNMVDWSVSKLGDALGSQFSRTHVKAQEKKLKESMPSGSETLLVWPKLSFLGERLGVSRPYDFDYGYCLTYLMSRMSSFRKFQITESCGSLNGVQLRPVPSLSRLYKAWEEKVKGELMIAPVQLGALYAGDSSRNARWKIAHSGQFPIDPLLIVSLLLTEPHALYDKGTYIDCPGALYSPTAGVQRDRILTFENSNFEPRLDQMPDGYVIAGRRSASGFLPKRMALK